MLQEVSDSLGKGAVRRKLEDVYSLAFLGQIWTLLFLFGVLAAGADFRVSAASLPTLLPRICLAAILALLAAHIVVRADRSTVGFLRSLTIPLLLGVDLLLGYQLSVLQIVGVVVMFAGLAWGFRHNPRGRKGASLVVISGLLGVITASLYKWNITYHNSVVGEQLVLHGCLMALFLVVTTLHSGSPLRLLFRPWSGGQSFANGLSSTVESFAYTYAPASVVIALKRGLALLWSVIFGRRYFHERHIRQKAFAGMVVLAGLALLTVPYLTPKV